MTKKVTRTILKIPTDASVQHGDHPYVDEIREDDEITSPKVVQETIQEVGTELIARDLVSSATTDAIAQAKLDYDDAKATGDQAAQIDALERIVDELVDVTTGQTLDELAGGSA